MQLMNNMWILEALQSRMKRAAIDAKVLIDFLKPLEPICDKRELRNITTSVTADSKVHC